VARHRAGQCGVPISSETKDLYILRNVQTDPGAHPVDTAGTFLGIKRLGPVADHSALSAEVKNGWSYSSFPLCVLLACIEMAVPFVVCCYV
jgi:hypothetical protein